MGKRVTIVLCAFIGGFLFGKIGERSSRQVHSSTPKAPSTAAHKSGDSQQQKTSFSESETAIAPPEKSPSNSFSAKQLSKHNYFLNWANSAPDQALQYLLKNEGFSTSRFLYESVIATWLEKNPQQFFDALPSLGSEEDRFRLIETAAHIMGSEPLHTERPSLESYLEPTGTLRIAALESYYAALAKAHPNHLFQLINNMESGQLKSDAIIQLAANIAQKDASAALQWYRQLQPSEDRDQVFQSLIDPLVEQNMAEAERVLAELSTNTSDSEAYRGLAMALVRAKAHDNFYTAIEWANSQISNDEHYQQILAKVGEEWIGKDPLLALENVVTWEHSPTKDEFLSKIALSESVPEKLTAQQATEFLQRLPNEKLQRTTVEHLVEEWFLSNPQEVSVWIGSLPIGLLKDTALISYVEKLYEYDEQEAQDVVNSLKNPALKARLQQELLNGETEENK